MTGSGLTKRGGFMKMVGLGRTGVALAAFMLAVPVGFLGLSAVTASAASATACSAASDYQLGYYWNPGSSDPNNVEGALAKLTIEQAPMCTGVPSGAYYGALSQAWVMVQGGPVGSHNWDQIGHFKWQGSSWYEFSQETLATWGYNLTYYDTTTPLALGSTHAFKIEWASTGCTNGVPACFINLMDGNQFDQSHFNPFASYTSPFIPSFIGEAYYPETGIPGEAGSHELFRQLESQNAFTNNWSATFPGGQTAENKPGTGWHDTTLNTCGGFLCFDTWTV
jgi:hypothetical protein